MRHSSKETVAGPALIALLLLAGAPAVSTAQVSAAPPIAAPQRAAPQQAGHKGSADRTTRTWTDPNIATLMLVESLGYADARAVVVRRPGDMPNNIILVSRTTTARDLATAASALLASRRAKGDGVDREIRAVIEGPATAQVAAPARGTAGAAPGAARAPAGKPSGSERRAAADLRRLRDAPQFTIPGIGRGPALVIRMSDPARPKK